ncbi:MAG: hypothetical protein ABIJ16_00785 [Bacteroidota bacterium]
MQAAGNDVTSGSEAYPCLRASGRQEEVMVLDGKKVKGVGGSLLPAFVHMAGRV